MHALIQQLIVEEDTLRPIDAGKETKSALNLRKGAVCLMYLQRAYWTSKVCHWASSRCLGSGQKSGRTSSCERWYSEFTLGKKEGSIRRTTLFEWKIQRSLRTDRAAISKTLRAEVIATRNTTFRVRNWRLMDPKGSKGGDMSTWRTRERSHVG